jgi:UDP-N-acetyl-D-glucosamine dehydrogenase
MQPRSPARQLPLVPMQGDSMASRDLFFADEHWAGGVIGLGYVGLPLAMSLSEAGLGVVGFDSSSERIRQLDAGHSPVDDVGDERLRAALDRGAVFTDRPKQLEDADALFLCVPSPLGRNREPDLSYIRDAVATVAEVVRPGMLVSLESTTYPGTTGDIVVPAVEGAGLTIDQDAWVAFSPERVSPGGPMGQSQIPKLVGGVTESSTKVAAAAYRRFVETVHVVSTSRVAEMAKLLENTYRAVNIGLINEMAQLADELDIDIWEVVDAASTKPFGFQPFYPGPGVGGHCIPLDPQFLAWRAREANFATRFIDLAEQVNSRMPAYTADRIARLLNSAGLPVFGTRILGVGIAYKADVADDRESASLAVLDELTRRGAIVSVVDPVVGAERIGQHDFAVVEPGEDLTTFAIAAVLTDHTELDLEAIAAAIPLVFDSRGAYRRRGLKADNVVVL